MSMIIDPYRFGGSPTLAAEYVTTATLGTNTTAYTFTSVSLGTAAADRWIVVAVTSRASTAVSSVTISVAGVSATVDKLVTFTGLGNSVAFASAAVPTGTTGDIVVTWSDSQLRCGVSVFKVTGGDLAVLSTNDGTNASPLTLDLATTVNGGAAFGATMSSGSSSAVYGWTGLTEAFDAQVAGENSTMSSAFVETTSASLSVSVTTTVSSADVAAASIAYEAV